MGCTPGLVTPSVHTLSPYSLATLCSLRSVCSLVCQPSSVFSPDLLCSLPAPIGSDHSPHLLLPILCNFFPLSQMVVIASRNIVAGVPEGGASAVMRSEVPMPHPFGRSRSLADIYRSNTYYNESQITPPTVPIGTPSQPISVYQPYWTHSNYWPYRYYRNHNTYVNYITDPFYWHYPYRLWSSHKQNFYHYDSPYYYRRYHDYYNMFYNTELMSYGNRSKMMENLYKETPITQ